MNSHLWLGERKRIDIRSSYLKMRLNLNKKDRSKDFQSLLKKRLTVINLEIISF